MDGVIYRGGQLIPGVERFLRWIKESKKRFTFLTNNSLHSPKQLQIKLRNMGLDLDMDVFVTASQSTASFLRAQTPRNGTCYVIGSLGLREGWWNIGKAKRIVLTNIWISGKSFA